MVNKTNKAPVKKISPAEWAWEKQGEAWMRQQKASIESCDFEIDTLQRRIKLDQKRLQLEKQERTTKLFTLNSFLKQFAKFKKERL